MKRLKCNMVLVSLVGLFVVLPAMAAQDSQMDRRKAAEANAQLAIAYMSQGDMTTARDKIEKALEQDSHTATTQLAAGFVYDRLGEDKKAQAHFEEALKLKPRKPLLLYFPAVQSEKNQLPEMYKVDLYPVYYRTRQPTQFVEIEPPQRPTPTED